MLIHHRQSRYPRAPIKTAFLCVMAVAGLLVTSTTRADSNIDRLADRLAGRLEARVDDQLVVFPTVKTDLDAEVRGDLVTVTVRQRFANPLDRPVHATYLFPLNKDAAVFEMTMEVGDERVRAEIKRKQEARETFEAAKATGRGAALLEQHRPNMFTQEVANLMPGVPIDVTLKYVHTVPKIDGIYELVMPLVVGPRYQPAGAGVPPQVTGLEDDVVEAGSAETRSIERATATAISSNTAFGQWELESLPAYPSVAGLDIPDTIDPDRVSIRISLDGGMPLTMVESRTHEIADVEQGSHTSTVTLANGAVIGNRDFVLHYQLAGEHAQAGLLSYRDDRGGFFSLLIEPPAAPAAADITPREMVFVLDTSGSMRGLPMDASKAFMREALRGLRPTDHFRIIRFSDAATEFSAAPLPATRGNIERGIAYADQLRGSGGTEMSSGIRQALQVRPAPGTIRLVMFLTDGYIGNEATILRLLEQQLGDARLYAFGVGTAVNRYLLTEMGRVGRGFTRYMDPTEDLESVALELAERLQSPVLTDISIDWGTLSPAEVYPAAIPDLFAGQSVRVQGRFERPGSHEIRITGRVNGRRATLPLRVDLPDASEDEDTVALVWARAAIDDVMHRLMVSGGRGAEQEAMHQRLLKQRVTELGLNFSLATKWTSFVAVSEKIYNPDAAQTDTLGVPLPRVEGVTEFAYGHSGTPSAAQPRQAKITIAQTSTGTHSPDRFVGSGTPEPPALLGIGLLALMMLAWHAWRRRFGVRAL